MTPSRSSFADLLTAGLSSDAIVRRDEPLARRTTLRVGGPADVYVEPASENDLAATVQFCAANGIPFFVLGRGSNLIVRDGGFRGVVISLAHPVFSQIEISGRRLSCGAGARLKQVAVDAKRNGLAGFEFLEGIPGTVGGALRMNAGAMGGETFQLVERVRVMDRNGTTVEMQPAAMGAAYRNCDALKAHIAISAVLVGNVDSPDAIAARMKVFSQKRWDSQPAAPSAGCMFRNPVAISAGKLIDELGLKGTRVGGASVSQEHGNFVVNDGTATASDVLTLIRAVQQRAAAERGIELHTEVEIIGEHSLP
ncbi:MAG TPA: UDP-N-acetylmuramate dehydrogenase [Verrucomicrobiae bacterium]|nr:UDP-N-acetylmuramate dehydrogenase [Verrucomicrobiae bacterium]